MILRAITVVVPPGVVIVCLDQRLQQIVGLSLVLSRIAGVGGPRDEAWIPGYLVLSGGEVKEEWIQQQIDVDPLLPEHRKHIAKEVTPSLTGNYATMTASSVVLFKQWIGISLRTGDREVVRSLPIRPQLQFFVDQIGVSDPAQSRMSAPVQSQIEGQRCCRIGEYCPGAAVDQGLNVGPRDQVIPVSDSRDRFPGTSDVFREQPTGRYDQIPRQRRQDQGRDLPLNQENRGPRVGLGLSEDTRSVESGDGSGDWKQRWHQRSKLGAIQANLGETRVVIRPGSEVAGDLQEEIEVWIRDQECWNENDSILPKKIGGVES
ncbi:hypothetical protein PF011_g26929 [Phytophthora fragariae]|uniref:Uncharacterized protein n=1 Tax=Phytophthora fragariae TaxID=53985 RepID=A0A6A3HIG0_9STRA|nr:hypothetical protein PF011_g26929 [Phytophthora fragariae]